MPRDSLIFETSPIYPPEEPTCRWCGGEIRLRVEGGRKFFSLGVPDDANGVFPALVEMTDDDGPFFFECAGCGRNRVAEPHEFSLEEEV